MGAGIPVTYEFMNSLVESYTESKMCIRDRPRRTTLKDEAGQAIVPLILNGTPMELDGQFLQIITTPLQKAQGILTNLETFEQQARLAATQGKAAGTAKMCIRDRVYSEGAKPSVEMIIY